MTDTLVLTPLTDITESAALVLDAYKKLIDARVDAVMQQDAVAEEEFVAYGTDLYALVKKFDPELKTTVRDGLCALKEENIAAADKARACAAYGYEKLYL